MPKKIGILGGTFDPIHKGHLMLAKTAYQQFSLDEVWILPNGNPPHKKEIEQTDFEIRCEMIRLAIADCPDMKLCRVESSEDCYHYTYRTLQYLTQKNPECRFFFIIGADSLNDFPTWKKPEVIAKLCTLLVACRDEESIAELREKSHEIERLFGGECRILNSPKVDAASNEIRTMLAEGENAAPYLDGKVWKYILKEKLYGVHKWQNMT